MFLINSSIDAGRESLWADVAGGGGAKAVRVTALATPKQVSLMGSFSTSLHTLYALIAGFCNAHSHCMLWKLSIFPGVILASSGYEIMKKLEVQLQSKALALRPEPYASVTCHAHPHNECLCFIKRYRCSSSQLSSPVASS